ncbi:MAG: hypothetical protein H6584_04780 [Flavobacteriales bacterium]|nr:hypothetical protein [Flavobacteriales bacterium]
MQKTHFYFSILFFLFFSSGFSQKEISIKVIPQNTQHPDIPTIPFEIEYKYRKFGIEYNHGFQYNPSPDLDMDMNEIITKINFNYFRSRLGFKYYRRDLNIKQFIGLNISYTPISFTRHNDEFYYKGDYYAYQSSDIAIKHYKIALLYGFKFPIYKITDIEVVSGLGIKYRHVYHNSLGLKIILPEDSNSWTGRNYGPTLIENPGDAFVPYVLMNVKFNFRIYNSKNKEKSTND